MIVNMLCHRFGVVSAHAVMFPAKFFDWQTGVRFFQYADNPCCCALFFYVVFPARMRL
jgi:hypothetical protein